MSCCLCGDENNFMQTVLDTGFIMSPEQNQVLVDTILICSDGGES